jgi:NTP pyrophosphatase (non-canonical NTP hydrolase)
MTWLTDFAESAERTDRFTSHPDHVELLATGLFGEAGSVLAELKKVHRERDAYPAYQRRMLEEVGDFLWYYVRLVSVLDRELLSSLESNPSGDAHRNHPPLSTFLDFGATVGDVLRAITKGRGVCSAQELRTLLGRLWSSLSQLSQQAQVRLQDASERNIQKVESRWPSEQRYTPLFDDEYPEDEQLPRRLDVEFTERSRGERKVVVLRCNGINFGDRVTDNIQDADGYRYHDVFHFAYAVHLGWSPMVRSLLRYKRKSKPLIDETEDGARAGILEEAASAIIFARAKHLNFFDGIDHLDYDLLKTVHSTLEGFEVASVPLWQWEVAILEGYRVFRQLRANRGGRTVLDLLKRKLTYIAHP